MTSDRGVINLQSCERHCFIDGEVTRAPPEYSVVRRQPASLGAFQLRNRVLGRLLLPQLLRLYHRLSRGSRPLNGEARRELELRVQRQKA